MISIALLDRQRLFLETFELALGRHSDIRVVGATAETRRAYELACAFKPDLLVSELILGDSDAFAVARELRRRRLGVGVAVLTMQASPAFVREAAAAGIRGYLLKSQPLREVVVGLERAAVDRYFAPAVGGPPENVPGAAAPDLLGRLSAREQEIFCRVLAGDTNRQIAQSLFISLKTVETHRTHINRKLGVHSPAELMRVAAVAGLLTEIRPGAPQPAAPAEPTIDDALPLAAAAQGAASLLAPRAGRLERGSAPPSRAT
jgi:two-component system response regulator NreC